MPTLTDALDLAIADSARRLADALAANRHLTLSAPDLSSAAETEGLPPEGLGSLASGSNR